MIGFAKDAWITTRLRTALTLDKNIQSINYSIDTVNGVVYLIGAAQNRMELNRVIETARTIPNVKRVVSYVKLVGKSISDSTEVPVTQYQQVDPDVGDNSSNYGYDDDQESMPDGYNPSAEPSNVSAANDLEGYDTYEPTPLRGPASGSPQPLIEVEPLDAPY